MVPQPPQEDVVPSPLLFVSVASGSSVSVPGPLHPSLGQISTPVDWMHDQSRVRGATGIALDNVSANVANVSFAPSVSASSFDPSALLFPSFDSGFSSRDFPSLPASSSSSAPSLPLPFSAPPPISCLAPSAPSVSVPIFSLPSVVPSVLSSSSVPSFAPLFCSFASSFLFCVCSSGSSSWFLGSLFLSGLFHSFSLCYGPSSGVLFGCFSSLFFFWGFCGVLGMRIGVVRGVSGIGALLCVFGGVPISLRTFLLTSLIFTLIFVLTFLSALASSASLPPPSSSSSFSVPPSSVSAFSSAPPPFSAAPLTPSVRPSSSLPSALSSAPVFGVPSAPPPVSPPPVSSSAPLHFPAWGAVPGGSDVAPGASSAAASFPVPPPVSSASSYSLFRPFAADSSAPLSSAPVPSALSSPFAYPGLSSSASAPFAPPPSFAAPLFYPMG